VPNRELENPVEHQPPASGPAPIEPEDELIKVAGQVGTIERSLVRAQQPALHQRRHPMHRRKEFVRVVAASTGSSLAEGDADIAELVDPTVARPAVGDDRRTGLDVLDDERMQRRGRRIRQRRDAASAHSLGLVDLYSDASEDLLSPSSSALQTWLLATNERLVDLDSAREPFASRPLEHGAEPVQHRPSRLVGTELQGSVKALG